MKRMLWVLTLVSLVMLSATPALSDGDFYVVAVGGGVGTKINSLPCTINSPGFYYLTKDLTLPFGNGITVNVNNVTIDLMGFRLNGEQSDSSAIVLNNCCYTEIRNGVITGWNYAISTSGLSVDHRVINIRAADNQNGFVLSGMMHLIKGCNIYNGHTTSSIGTGISMDGGTVSGNQIRNCVTGIELTNNVGGTIINNFVFNCNTCISVNYSANIIGNYISCLTGQTGISGTSLTMIDQNTVSGPGNHQTGINSAAFGTNSGVAPPPLP